MPKNLDDLNKKYSQVKGLANIVQIDVMDGKFVSSISWPYIEDDGKPLSIDFDFEADLMVLNPEIVVGNWIKAGAKRVIAHIESIDSAKNFEKIFDAVSDKAKLGIALNTTTSNDAIYPIVDKIDFAQFMGIEKIGFQGQLFDERALGKIADLRERFPKVIISVDGGVNMKNAPRLIKTGANRLVSGSTIFESDNIKDAIEKLKNY